MPDGDVLLSQLYVTIDGEDASDDFMQALHEVTVESSLHLPDVAILILHDSSLMWVDDSVLAPRKVVRISADSGDGELAIFDGEIVELEPEFSAGSMQLVVRAFDRLHRLARGRHVRSFQNVTHGDLVEKLAHEVGLQSSVATTSYVHEYVLQNNESNLEFLARRSARLGYLLHVRDDTLHCEPPASNGQSVELEWGVTLSEFRPRLTTIGQVEDVTVRGWDPAAKKEIVGHAENGHGAPEIGESDDGGALARDAFSIPAHRLVTDRPIRSQAEADQLAQAVADHVSGSFIQAEGTCGGEPGLLAGARVDITAVGDRFSGAYFVTGATHRYSPERGYTTQFSVTGHQPLTLTSLLMADPASTRVGNLVVGIVTDNQDPEGQGRVKVRFPSLSDEHASDWARVVAPGAGAERGVQFLPEVNDEVLVGFELGDVHYPYVIGGLWNGQDALPEPSGEVVGSGRVQRRIIKSRSGHVITLDDSDGGGGIIIEDKNGNRVALDTSSNSLAIEIQGNTDLKTSGNLTLEAQGRLQIKGGAGVTLESPAQVDVSGAVVNLN